MTNENKKISYQLIFVHIFRKKHFKDNLENFMSESLNATSTPLSIFRLASSGITIISLSRFKTLQIGNLEGFKNCNFKCGQRK